MRLLTVAFFCVLAISCTSGPEKINFGEDPCVYCRMMISDPKYGALLVTDKGRIRKYDAIECMINELRENRPSYKKLKVVPYDQPQGLIPADSAYFVTSEAYKSPMGAHLAAFADPGLVPDSLSLMRWSDVVKEMAMQ